MDDLSMIAKSEYSGFEQIRSVPVEKLRHVLGWHQHPGVTKPALVEVRDWVILDVTI